MDIRPSEYLQELRNALAQLDSAVIRQAADVLEKARQAERTIFIIGNGGSAATASHFANDLNKLASISKSPAFRALALGDNLAQLTAWANDTTFRAVFAAPLDRWARAGDVLISITTSGESDNIRTAMLAARELEVTNILLVGCHGSSCAQLANLVLCTLAPRQTQQEDIALAVCHALADALR